MSQQNVEAVRGVYARWGEGDFSGSVELFDPAAELVMRPEFPDAGVHAGVEGIARYTRGFLEPWSWITISAEEYFDAGDTVVVAVRQRGMGEASGADTELPYFHVWTFRDARAIRLETVRERADAFAAAGISDPGLP